VKVLIDEKPFAVSRPDVATALAEGVRSAEDQGRVIVEVLADGARLDDAALASGAVSRPVNVLELRSADPRTLIARTLHDAAEALIHAKSEQLVAATAIQRGEPEKSLEPIGSALETWQLVRDAVVRSGALLGLDLAGPHAREIGSPGVDEKELVRVLGVVRDALTNEDWAALSDGLAYDLCPQAERWQESLTNLAEAIESGRLSGEQSNPSRPKEAPRP